MIPSTASKRARTAAALDYLARRFPAAFRTDPAAVQPLAVGVRDQIAARVAADPGADAPAVLWALRRWCLSRAYVEAVAAGRVRVDLDGRPVEAPAVEHQAQARARLETEGTATAARAQRRERAELAQARAKGQAGAPKRVAGKAAGRSAPATTAPDTTRPAARAGTATVVTRARAGRLATPTPASNATSAPPPRPVLGLGRKRPKPPE